MHRCRTIRLLRAFRNLHSMKTPSGPEITIRDITFSGFIQMPVAEQDEIVASIKQKKYVAPLDGLVEEAVERIKAGWQDRGYIKVKATGNAKTVDQSPSAFYIALFVNVEENLQYRLGGIRFKNNRAITNVKAMRELFPIKDGDIFSRTQIAKGLEGLRKMYGQYGYANYTGVPATTFDDAKKLAYVLIDIDEGKQFYISDIRIEGVDDSTRQKMSKELAIHRGDIYNIRLVQLSTDRIHSVFPLCECEDSEKLRLNVEDGTAVVTLDFRPCPGS